MHSGRLKFPLLIGGALLLFAAVVVAALLLLTHDDTRVKVGDRTIELTAAEAHGRDVFGGTCGRCHTLAASNTKATVGPNLDVIQAGRGQLEQIIASGAQGPYNVMPAGVVQDTDAEDVAAYVAKVADRKHCCGVTGS